MKKLFAAGIMTETNTFAPFPTGMADYEIMRATDFGKPGRSETFGTPLNVWAEMCFERGWTFCPGLFASAQPAGITPRPVYETLRNELLDDLKGAMPVDMVLLNLHGAMVAEGYDDCETDLVDCVRQTVGPDVQIGIELDLHCDLTDQLMAQTDAIVLYKEYPHIDIADRARELFEIIAGANSGTLRPTMAYFDCKMLGFYLTPHQPMRGFVDSLSDAEEEIQELLSLSLFHTFPWGDVPSAGVKMLAVTDNNPALAAELSEKFGRQFFEKRHELLFDSLSMEDAIDRALAHSSGPVVLADQSDNAGGGAPSDSTFMLRELLACGVTNVALGMIWDPIAVQIAIAGGEGAELELRIGGKIGPMSGDPLDLRVTVSKIVPNMFQEWPQGKNRPLQIGCGDSVALHCQGIDIVVNSKRSQVFSPQVFSNLGIDPTERKILVVKSTQHFYAAFEPIAAEIIYTSPPGAIAPNMKAIPFERVDMHKFPWVDDPFLE